MLVIKPPFNLASAMEKVRMAENAWNSKNPEKIDLAYSEDSNWRNRDSFIRGRKEIIKFLHHKWELELNYHLIKELWIFCDDKIAVRFCYEWHDINGQWYRSYGNENWSFDEQGLMTERYASINDLKKAEKERLFHWPYGQARPISYPSLSDLGL
ncbi:DUF1348 family protein [Neisseriaceae bacterium PsAf]|nr:DUF1348 family protein [Neisseriaceae bacterium PsAf]